MSTSNRIVVALGFFTFALVMTTLASRPADFAIPRAETFGLKVNEDSLTQRLNRAEIVLGGSLFNDVMLSKDSTLSCASCHQPTHGFAEPTQLSHGIGPDARRRNTPTILNVDFDSHFDWDGRATTLEDQLSGVFDGSGDMGMDIGEAVRRVRKSARYRRLFEIAFNKEPDVQNFKRAIANFERSMSVGNSRFDKFMFGSDSLALSDSEKRGWKIFSSERAGCGGCHVPFESAREGGTVAMFTDRIFHNLGVGYRGNRMSDLGRYLVTRRSHDWGAFKTPSLRNVELTAPYMHDGSLATLADVVAFYSSGAIQNPNLDAGVSRQSLSYQEQEDLVAFLRSLTSESLLKYAGRK